MSRKGQSVGETDYFSYFLRLFYFLNNKTFGLLVRTQTGLEELEPKIIMEELIKSLSK